MPKPKRKSRSGPSGPTLSQERRREMGRPVVSMILSSEALAELDRRRGTMPRGAYVEELLRLVRPARKG